MGWLLGSWEILLGGIAILAVILIFRPSSLGRDPAALESVVKQHPNDADGWDNLGIHQIQNGQFDAAIRTFERMLLLGNRADSEALHIGRAGPRRSAQLSFCGGILEQYVSLCDGRD